MRRIVIHRAGSYDRLTIREGPALEPREDGVVVAVEAIGVNYADCMVRMGLYQSAKDFVGWPITPGFEVAGRVARVGNKVTDLAVGDPVLAVTLFGGYATEVAVPRPYVFRLPRGADAVAMAGFPAVFMTAYFALFELAHPRPGAKLLVHSAAGGVGGALVQLGRLAGCEVTGVVGATHKLETLTRLGVDHAIDKSTEPLWDRAEAIAPDGFDVVCDANGVATLAQSYAHLRRAGKLVVYGFHTMIPRRGGKPNWVKLAVDYLRTPRFNPFQMTTESLSVLAFNLSYLFDRFDILEEAMTRLMGWLDEGQIVPAPVERFAFEAAGDAHRRIESGESVGKLVLLP
jgi:NADPH:quinone reductase-like Zn-dependent oxidoreductase